MTQTAQNIIKLISNILFWRFLPTDYMCRGLLLRLITLNDTYTLGGFPLDEGSALRVDLYLYNIQVSQDTDIHASGVIRTRNPTEQTAAY